MSLLQPVKNTAEIFTLLPLLLLLTEENWENELYFWDVQICFIS